MSYEDLMMTRSPMFALPPIIGPGSETESLVSYMVRLARAHQIKVRPLIREVLWPELKLDAESLHVPFFRDQARTVNGVGRYANAFVGALQTLTSIQNLGKLTFLSWKGVIPEVGPGFLAKEVKWCPECLAEQRLNGTESYFPLVWSLEHYRVCLRHGRHLHSRCPWCGKPQHVVPHYPDQARCTHCCGFLAPTVVLTADEPIPKRECRRAKSLDSLIVGAGQEIVPTHEQLMLILAAAADRWADGEKKRLSLMLGLGPKTIGSWSSKNQKPAFPLLLQIAEVLGVTVQQFFTQTLPKSFPSSLPNTLLQISKRQGTEMSMVEIEARLIEYRDDPHRALPVSLILKQLNLTRSYAKYWFPELMLQLAKKHQAQRRHAVALRREGEVSKVASIFREVVAGGNYPSVRRMSQALRPYRLSLQRLALREEYNRLRGGIIDPSSMDACQ